MSLTIILHYFSGFFFERYQNKQVKSVVFVFSPCHKLHYINQIGVFILLVPSTILLFQKISNYPTPLGKLELVKVSISLHACYNFSEPTCESRVDLCFIIDSSGSIRDNNVAGQPDNWILQLEFITNIVRAFSIGPDASQIGAVVFSNQARLEFALNAYDNNQDVTDAILDINYVGGETDTLEALVQTRTQCFNPSYGDRRDVDNLAIIVTDGVPNPSNLRQPAIEEARRLRDAGTLMVSVGITDVIDEAFLKEMSSSPQTLGTNYFTATNFAALAEIRKVVVEGTCGTTIGNVLN